jgi:hypothetical protein
MPSSETSRVHSKGPESETTEQMKSVPQPGVWPLVASGGPLFIGFPSAKVLNWRTLSTGEIMFKFGLLQLALLLLASTSLGSAQFAHTDHKQIVDAAGKPLLLRATNLANWLVPEGYMWLFQSGPQSPSEIRALVLELLGPEWSAAFWQKYRENYVTRQDIALLHRAGFNAS